MLYTAMFTIFLILMYSIHETVAYFAEINPLLTFLVGFGTLISIAVCVDRKDGFY